ncbi:hypothetical protein GCM10011374_38310 [Kocuria dechangensis]|uniref:DUF1772 domain-containing protein n=1 Tax=Kocuria dechangensis TaxID=1176249 RepID=A0A917H7M9_9MICC|nr:DUF1772 domain-containing protein [Kocuria dechangensis]GGG70092.1 hypothetical protein GCM10011374_38310 [Kocuria dechangensis]
MIAEIGLGASVVAAGLWSGLLLTVTTILHPLFGRQDAAGFATEMHRFLPIARRSPTNYILVATLLLAPPVALVGLGIQQAFGAAFVLTATGLVATVAGPLLISRRLAEPNYALILGWNPQHPPDDWQVARDRWYRHNWMRAALTWVAFALFLAASYAHLG